MGLLVRSSLPGVPHDITMLLHVVIIVSTVLFSLDVLVSVSDMWRVDSIWAIPAVEGLTLLIERQAL